MTDHQRARRARKSKIFFAKLAERAALAGNLRETERLLTAMSRKRFVQHITESVSRMEAITARALAA
jgi:hypothetical protein